MRKMLQLKLEDCEHDLGRALEDMRRARHDVREMAVKHYSAEEIDAMGMDSYVNPSDALSSDSSWVTHALDDATRRDIKVHDLQVRRKLLQGLLARMDEFEPEGQPNVDDAARELVNRMRTALGKVKANSTYKKDLPEMRFHEGKVQSYRGALQLLGYTDDQIDRLINYK